MPSPENPWPSPVGTILRAGFARLRDQLATVDERSLALFRILISAVLLLEVVQRWPMIDVYYSNLGIASNYGGIWLEPNYPRVSLLHGFATADQVRGFFVFSAAVYVMFMVGYRTKLAHVLTLICASSIHLRSGMLFYGGDIVAQAFLLWSIFLPLGRRWSIDRWLAEREQRARPTRPIVSVAFLGCVIQLAMIYGYNSLDKFGEHWRNGDAMHYVLHFEDIARPVGIWAREFFSAEALDRLTWVVLYMELWGGIALLIPWRSGWIRLVALTALGSMHLGIYLTMNVGAFSPTLFSVYALFIGAGAWERIGRWKRSPARVRAWVADVDGEVPSGAPRLRRGGRWLSEGLAASNLYAVILSSLAMNAPVPDALKPELPKWAHLWLAPFSAYHHWGLFAPEPPLISFWVVIEGETRDGRTIDPLTGEPPLQEITPGFANRYPPMVFSFMIHMFRLIHDEPFQQEIERFVWRSHTIGDRTEADAIVRFRVYSMGTKTALPGEGPEPVRHWREVVHAAERPETLGVDGR